MPHPARARFSAVAWSAVFAAAASAYFVMQTLASGSGGIATLVLLGSIAAAVLVLIATGVPTAAAVREVPVRTRWLLLVAGALGLGVAPLLVAAHRYTDAPSGSEVLFFTTASWAAIGVLMAALARDDRATGVKVAIAGVALVAAAGILADWERPSSFSPFMKFPAEEAWMLVAGTLWAVFAVVLRRASVRHGARVPAALTVIAGAAATLVALAVSGRLVPAFAGLAAPRPVAVAGALAFGVVVLAWTRLAPVQPLVRSSALLFLPPALLTGVTFAEGAFGVTGPRPLVVRPLLGALALLAVALVGLFTEDGPPIEDDRVLPPRAIAPLAALLAAAAGLTLPALRVAVSGSLPDGSAFDTRFTYAGFETAGGWLAMTLAALLVVAAFTGRGLYSARRSLRMGWAIGYAAAGSVWLVLGDVPLHTWNRWIPPAVQQDYGTEYATIAFTPLPVPVQAAAVLACVAIAALVAVMPSRNDSSSDRRSG